MSSFTGSPTVSDSSDPSLQLAPTGESGPDVGALKKSFETCVANNQPYADQCRLNYETRYALWNGQSADGKKHTRPGNGQVDPVPWDGASDLRVFLADDAINSMVAMECTAIDKANIVAVPVEGNDIKRAKLVSTFIRWLIQTQIPELDREMELLSNYVNEKGLAVTGQFWERIQEKTLITLSLEQLQAMLGEGQSALELVADPAMEDTLLGLLEEQFGASTKRAKKMVRELRETGQTTAVVVGKERSRPVLRAFNLDENVFLSDFATDIESAPAIFRVEYFYPEKLRALVNTDGWDSAWVEAAIDKVRGQLITIAQNEYNQPISRSFVYNQQRFTDQVGVVYAYQRLSDEDGVPGIYCTIFNPQLPADPTQPGYAKHTLLGYSHGQYPFVLHRREYLSRKVHDSRGLPEPLKPSQDQIKAHRDSQIDAASLAILPPMMYPIGRPPSRWGAGARVPERRPGEYHFADRPAYDPTTEKSQSLLVNSAREYVGMASPETDPTFASLKNQFQVNKRMKGISKAIRQIWSLYQQFGPEQVFFRVIGSRQEDPLLFQRGDTNEEFDFYLTWDVQSMDAEKQTQKLEALARVCATFDKYGQVDYSEVLQLAVETIDPTWGERLILPKDVGGQKVVKETHDMLAQVFAGVDRDIDLNSPPEMVLQIIQNYAQAPDVQQRYQQDEAFRARLDKLVKQANFQLVQKENARVGRWGA